MNELAEETSPYLLQHAQNPVHWKAWNGETLALAQARNKLIIVSTGYSACHWCHVMEHESFEDAIVADTMNRNYISIKVDREERPDIDAVYMKAVQLMTGRGGWPMNVICLPDGRPVWGGTYFPKAEWINSLDQLAELYESNPEKMLEYAEKLHNGIQSISVIQPQETDTALSQDLLEQLLPKWIKSFDTEFGGYGRAPKFMMPNNWEFLMRYGHQTQNETVLNQVDLTLTKMAYGGLFDVLGGGFSRYSVDMKWHVPHFEKMLYDIGQLVSLYANAYKRTKNPLYQEVIEKTLSFIARELTNDQGGFYSALDADSLNAAGKLEEGAFYVWTVSELQSLLGGEFELFSTVFNINAFGYWEEDHYVLIQNQSLDEIAKANQIDLRTLQQKKESWEKLLFNARLDRHRPRLDDKCLTSWNAIMMKGYLDAYAALDNEAYLTAAIANAHFITQNVLTVDGNLLHNHKDGRNTINGYLEDYAHVIEAFITLYQTTFDDQWLITAKQLTDYCFDHFYDSDSGFFLFTSNLDPSLISPHFEVEDNVISASNSVMAHNLYKLGILFENTNYEMVSHKMLAHILQSVDYPSSFANWMQLLLNHESQNKELAICGENAIGNAKHILSGYYPNIVLAGTTKESAIPFLKDRFVPNRNQFYLCENKTCDLPSENFNEIISKL